MLTTLLVIFQDSQMPLELRQPPPVPQPVNQTESGLEQAQHWSAQIVYQAVLARGDSIGSPQQQPDIDQGQRQQQPSQAFPMLQASQFQPEAPAIIFVVFEHLLDLEALAVAGTSPFPVGLRGQQIPRLLAPPVPVHRQVETTNGMFLGESYIRPKVALSRTQGWQHLDPLSPFPAHILLGPQPQAEAPALAQGPLAKTPVPNSRSPSKITWAPCSIQPATVPKTSRCSAKLEAPGFSICPSRGSARPRQPTLT